MVQSNHNNMFCVMTYYSNKILNFDYPIIGYCQS